MNNLTHVDASHYALNRAIITGSRFLAAVVVLTIVFGLTATTHADVKLQDSGEKPVTKKAENRADWITREIVLRNDKISHSLKYDRYLDKDGNLGGSNGISALNVNHLYSAPWFAFNVTSSQGVTLARQPFTVTLLDGQIDRKGVVFLWDLPQGQVELRLILRDEDPNLYGQITTTHKNENPADATTITISTAPGGYCPTPESRDRWMILNNEDQQHGAQPATLPASGSLLLYDKILDPKTNSHGHGAAGWLWAAGQPDANLTFSCGSYTSTMRITRKGQAPPFRFALRAFIDIPNENTLSEFPAEVPATLEILQATDVGDTLFDVPEKIQIRPRS